MRNAFASKMSYFILTFIFLIITASFLFSGFDKFSLGGGKNVATVDGTEITIKEYKNAMNRQIEFFTQMMGGKGMTQKQFFEFALASREAPRPMPRFVGAKRRLRNRLCPKKEQKSWRL